MSEETKRNNTNRHDPNLIRSIISRGRLVWRLMGDRRVPALLKGLPLLTLLYLVSPIDLAPALAMGPLAPLGAMDDLAVILLGLTTFINLAPSNVVAEHERDLSVAGGWRVEDTDTPPASGDASSADETPPMVEGFYRIVDDEES